MKYIILFSISILFLKCSQKSNESETAMNVSVKFDDEKSNAIRNHFDNYMKNDTAALRSLSSPDNKLYVNSFEAISIDEILNQISNQHQIFDDISVIGLGGIDTTTAWVQSIYYPNDGPIHTDTWFRWRATGKFSGKLIEFPCHLVFEWEDNKIIKEWHYYDGSQMLDEIALANK